MQGIGVHKNHSNVITLLIEKLKRLICFLGSMLRHLQAKNLEKQKLVVEEVEMHRKRNFKANPLPNFSQVFQFRKPEQRKNLKRCS